MKWSFKKRPHIDAGKIKNENAMGDNGKMKDIFANRLRELRRERGMGQEQLASVCGVSVQAVSKWECAQSYPDIELLETIAETFGVTIDALLRESAPAEANADKEDASAGTDPGEGAKSIDDRLLDVIAEKFGVKREDIGSVDIHMGTGDENVTLGVGVGDAPVNGLPDDGVLRVVQFIGNRPVTKYHRGDGERIPLALSGFEGGGKSEIKIEIWGDADLDFADNREVGVSITAGGDVNVGDVRRSNNGSVNGSVTAGGEVNCGIVNGSASAGGEISCGTVNGSASAGGDINGGTVNGPANAGGDVNCGDVAGNVTAGGDVSCGDVSGHVDAEGDVDCGEVCGNVDAGGDVSCGDVAGSASAGGDVDCGDVGGDAKAGGDVDCGRVEGNVYADGDVDCGDIGGVSVNGKVGSSGSIRIETGSKKKKSDGFDFEIPDLSGLGEQISRTVNEAIDRAFGKKKRRAEDGDGEDGGDDD